MALTSLPRAWTPLAGFAAGYALARALRPPRPRPPRPGAPRVVVLGAGFAGLSVAGELHHRLGSRIHVVLVDRHNYHLFTPLLYQVATCGVDPYAVAFQVRQFAAQRGIDFRPGSVTDMDFARRRVLLDSGEEPYDFLVIALGTTTNFFHNESAEKHAFALKWLEEGISIRNHVVDALERASMTQDAEERKELLTFVVVGGGATGVETAGALADLLRNALRRYYPAISPAETRVLIVESEHKLLGFMDDQISTLALRELRSAGVEVWLNTRASEVAPTFVRTNDGRSVASATVLWTSGVRVPDVVASLDVAHGRGGSIEVDVCLQVPTHPGVYAAGDNASVKDARTGQPVPLLAATATRQGEVVAENIGRALQGKPPKPYVFQDMGSYVTLGRQAGVAEYQKLVLTGLPGWLAWRLIHVVLIANMRNRLFTLLDWSTGYVFGQDTTRLDLIPSAPDIHAPQEKMESPLLDQHL